MTVALSDLDEQRFGIRTAKTPVTEATLPQVLEFCRAERVELCIARCPADDLSAAQALERAGFQIMDTLVYYERDLATALPEPQAGPFTVRPVREGEQEAVRAVAAEAFRGYGGHYHADPRLDPLAADEVYASWAERSCTDRAVADEVLVAELDGALVGLTTVRLDGAGEAEGLLDGVAPAARGRGVFRALLLERLRWSRAHGARTATVSTQITNLAAQRAWTKLGYLPLRSLYTFHGWFTGR